MAEPRDSTDSWYRSISKLVQFIVIVSWTHFYVQNCLREQQLSLSRTFCFYLQPWVKPNIWNVILKVKNSLCAVFKALSCQHKVSLANLNADMVYVLFSQTHPPHQVPTGPNSFESGVLALVKTGMSHFSKKKKKKKCILKSQNVHWAGCV